MTSAPDHRAAQLLAAYSGPDVSVADLLCDRHPADAVAVTVVEPDLTGRDLTYGHLRAASERFAAALAHLGVRPGDRVATLMGKSADLVVVLLGIWRAGAVHVPLFTAFAPPAIDLRLAGSAAKVVVTDTGQRGKLDGLTGGWAVVVAGSAGPDGPLTVAGSAGPDGPLTVAGLIAAEQPGSPAVSVGGQGPIVQLFTSGTTGEPKAVLVPALALAAFQTYLEYGLDVRPDDVFWNAADPGWAYGLYYGILAPLVAGRRTLLLQAAFSPELTWQVLDRYRVTNFAAAPTVYRAMRAVPAVADLPLRACSSAGEPLNPEVVSWAERTLGIPVRDQYGQTEMGMSIVNGWHPDVLRPLRPGSMGHSMPGWQAYVLRPAADEVAGPGEYGRVAVDMAASPLAWFTPERGYAGAPERTAERFSPDGRWYYTGDAGSVDADGYFFFSSRDDDVIIMAGYRIGPFEIESVLVEHPDVLDAAVIGVPDELRGEVIEAYVVLRRGATGGDTLVEDLKARVKSRYAAHAYPRSIHVVDTLPRTPSGKLQRFVLRQERTGDAAETGRS